MRKVTANIVWYAIQPLPFEADHIIAEKHGGATQLENLAWACSTCNHYKGSDIRTLDPLSGRLVLLYNPRKQTWSRHFRRVGAHIDSLTAHSRVTTKLLRLNDEWRVSERLAYIAQGLYP